MREIYFNFNNEVDVLTLEQNEETGVVTVLGQEDLSFDSIEAFAEHYALARDVHPTNLKNWVLMEQGDTFVFSQRAATGGIPVIPVRDLKNELEEVLVTLGADFHVLDIKAVQDHLEGAKDIITALTGYENKVIAKAVYDELAEMGAFDVEEEEVDERSEVEKVLDKVLEDIDSLALFARALNLGVDASKEDIMEQAELLNHTGESLLDEVDTLVNSLSNTTKVNNLTLLSALISQEATGIADEDEVRRLVSVSRIAGRNTVNVTLAKVGKQFIKNTSKRVELDEVAEMDLRLVDGSLTAFDFDEDVDEVVKAEIRKAQAEYEARMAEMEEYDEDYDEDYDEWDEDYDDGRDW